MMRTSAKLLLGASVAFFAAAGVCFAQSPQKIIDEYVRAEGGAKALANIQTASITGSVTDDATGKSGSYTLITKAPNKFYSEMIVEPHRVIEAYNGKSAWGQGKLITQMPVPNRIHLREAHRRNGKRMAAT